MRVLDLTALKCPLPVLRTRKAIKGMVQGEAFAVLATDPMAAIDIPHLCQSEGHHLKAQSQSDGVLRFVIVVGPKP